MVSSSLLQLHAKGPIDKVMYGNPQVTYFKNVYKRPTNFASQYISKSLTNAEWGSTVIVRVPREGDLLGGVYIRLKLSDLIRKYRFFKIGAMTIKPGNDQYGQDFQDPTNNSDFSGNLNQGPNAPYTSVDDKVLDYVSNHPVYKLGFLSSLSNQEILQVGPNGAGGNAATLASWPSIFDLNDFDKTSTEPEFTSFVNGLGANIIEHISVFVGNKLLERIPGEWIHLNNELNNNNNAKSMFNDSIYYHNSSSQFQVGTTNTKDIDLMIPVPFFFANDSGMHLPIMAMHNEHIEIRIKLRTLEECLITQYQNNSSTTDINGNHGVFKYSYTEYDGTTAIQAGIQGGPLPLPNKVTLNTQYTEEVSSTINNAEIIYKFYHLEENEKLFFLTKRQSYIVPIVKEMSDSSFNYIDNSTQYIELDLRNPVKYIAFVLQRNDNYTQHDYFNYTKEFRLTGTTTNGTLPQLDKNKYMLDEFVLSTENIDAIPNIPSKILNNIELYSKFRNNSDTLIYVYSFGIYPNEVAPSGSLNFSQLKDQRIKLKLINPSNFNNQPINFRGYYVGYNILTIDEGLTGFRFY